MAVFYPLFVRRSDGKKATITKGKKDPNEPTGDQLDQKPDKNGVADFYREVQPDEAKHVDWRRKLGGMLARELEWKEKSANGMSVVQGGLPMDRKRVNGVQTAPTSWPRFRRTSGYSST